MRRRYLLKEVLPTKNYKIVWPVNIRKMFR
jgi:hypothetical protein